MQRPPFCLIGITCVLIACAQQPGAAHGHQTRVHNDKRGSNYFVDLPNGWRIDSAATEALDVDVVFRSKEDPSAKGEGTIRIICGREGPKFHDAFFAEEMWLGDTAVVDMIPEEIPLSHPKYPVEAKLFSNKDFMYEYRAYLDLGPDNQGVFAVAMNTGEVPATGTQLDVFEALVASMYYRGDRPEDEKDPAIPEER